jgi:TatD DNase family protein
MAWVDSHCHVQYEGVGLAAVAAARDDDVLRVVTIGTDATESRKAIDVARAADDVWATVGVHPHDATEGVDGILPMLGEPEVVAVGECGLDYHYDHSPRDVQRRVFAAQVALAREHDLALVVHTRDAWDDTFDVLAAEGVPARTVLHCFTGGPDEARRGLDIGAYLSFSGIVTFKGADDVRAAAAVCPLDRVLVETDAPFLAPVPHRGQPNRPAWVAVVGEAVAAAKNLDVHKVEAATWANTSSVFRLDSVPFVQV